MVNPKFFEALGIGAEKPNTQGPIQRKLIAAAVNADGTPAANVGTKFGILAGRFMDRLETAARSGLEQVAQQYHVAKASYDRHTLLGAYQTLLTEITPQLEKSISLDTGDANTSRVFECDTVSGARHYRLEQKNTGDLADICARGAFTTDELNTIFEAYAKRLQDDVKTALETVECRRETALELPGIGSANSSMSYDGTTFTGTMSYSVNSIPLMRKARNVKIQYVRGTSFDAVDTE